MMTQSSPSRKLPSSAVCALANFIRLDFSFFFFSKQKKKRDSEVLFVTPDRGSEKDVPE